MSELTYRALVTRERGCIVTAYCRERKTEYFDTFEDGAKADYSPGDIFLGRVSHLVPNISAAFVEFLPGVNGYLDLRNLPDQGKNLTAGSEIAVQVTRIAIGKKEASLTANLQWIGHYAILNLDRRGGGISISARMDDAADKKRLRDGLKERFPEENLILRTNGCELFQENEDEFWTLVTAEVERLKEQRDALLKKFPYQAPKTLLSPSKPDFCLSIRDFGLTKLESITTDQPDLYPFLLDTLEEAKDKISLTEYAQGDARPADTCGLSDAINEALKKRVYLKSGANIVIEQTEAMVVIDVNTAKSVDSGKDREAHYLEINKEAALQICRQIRNRNLSGMILVDFIDLAKSEDQTELIRFLKAELKKDPAGAAFIDLTRLGIAELTRKKVRKPLFVLLSEKSG